MRRELIAIGALALQACGSNSGGPTAPSSALPPHEITTMRIVSPADADIWTMDDDGRNQRDLSRGPDFDQHPIWASDGSAIFFERDIGLTRDIWRMNPNGSGQTRLTDVLALAGHTNAFISDEHPTAGILFNVRGMDAVSTIWKVAADGSGAQLLNANAPSRLLGTRPRWSADGTRIAFSTLVHTVSPIQEQLWVMDADGTNPRMLFTATAEAGGPRWDWDPAGDRLALARDVDGGHDIWLVPADGSAMTRLTTGANAGYPLWSPDGTRIAYRDVDTNAMLVIDFDGTNPVSLLVNGSNLHWSSDGTRIAYCDATVGFSMIGADGQHGRAIVSNVGCADNVSYRP